ncbi:MAG: hypothetical protein HYV34_00835 [Candidatus Kerfeldbacteria bacterium]|nr:hypothetical protein [Candidatus Kerfeldbacteria bacterium]
MSKERGPYHFKVDHVLIEALRGSSTGLLYGGRMWGQTNPRMLDASSLLYLRDGKQILRVVVVSPDATRVFLADLLGEWQGRFESGTYIWKTLKELEKVGPLTAEWLLPNQQFLDQLALACDDPLERRPLVRVWGTPIVEGIVIATALQVGNTRAVFLPSGHFRAFADAARPFVGETTLPAPLRLKKG